MKYYNFYDLNVKEMILSLQDLRYRAKIGTGNLILISIEYN